MITRQLGATTCAAALLMPAAALALPPALVATNLAGTFTYPAAPEGFDPFTAAPELVTAYGYPPRPSRVAAKAFATWARFVRGERHRIVPILQQTNIAAGAAFHASAPHGVSTAASRGAGTSYSKNWSGAVITNGVTQFSPGSLVSAFVWFNVPAANQALGVCTGGWDYLFSWVGVDGWLNNEVFQAGTASDAYCNNGTAQQDYSAWYEWYPTLSVRITNLPVSPGDAMGVWVIASSNHTGTAYVTNETTGVGTSVAFSAPAGTVLVGNSAEWVQERPTVNKVLSTLTNYAADWMSTEGAMIPNNGQIFTMGNPGNGSALLVTMEDNSGQSISFPTQLGGNGTMFTVEGSAR
jgi:hypothetical protein